MPATTPRYRGRFAPSPTGPLHFGSLIAAIGSYLQARSQRGEWLVRMEDLDPPREQPGAAATILRTLERYGFEWDGAVLYQSRRHEAYLDTLEQLRREGYSYRCNCSRKQIGEEARRCGLPPGVYPGSCRTAAIGEHQRHTIRLLAPETVIGFDDGVQGHFSQQLAREVGDFVLRRADGLFAYQLAVVVDDAFQGITEVVRGSDLLDNTPRQIALQRSLGLRTPGYLHLPVVLNARGEKLSKQTFAPALDETRPLPALWQGLAFLGQRPIPELLQGDISSFWRWAVEHWHRDLIPRKLDSPLKGAHGNPD
ncbi:MAG: tRNA glutamyl-Q(34) synthetase GluQRS [Gammaproteobacteria bacterium]|nr:tRNA glutamyl-Q(34) synthetase GluQRS [Gammaproteobacteria bacterium]